MRMFNIAGPMIEADHYLIPPLERWDLGEILLLIAAKQYFVLHAPRQTGKTTALLALRDHLNRSGDYRCVYANLESGQSARGDVEAAMRTVLGQLRRRARTTNGLEEGGSLAALVDGALESEGAHGALEEVLTRWSRADPKPLVVLLDEIDALIGDSLIAVLRQIRAGYDTRPENFPQSVALCGVRDVRDYRMRSKDGGEKVAGGSPFNIKAESLRLGDFSERDVRALLAQHTEETGQQFTPDALRAVWRQTRGQPWLVNALARQACFRHKPGRDRSRAITASAVMAAREALILRRETHLDQLADKLREPRVRRVIEPLLSGEYGTDSARDREYARDMGLLAPDSPPRLANPIYAEVVPRELTWALQDEMLQRTAWYVDADGALDMDKLLAAFQGFFRENSEHWIQRAQYTEAGPQLVLQAFLHRVVNARGRIGREYALGSRRVDLLVTWPRGRGRDDLFVVECKLVKDGRSHARAVERGLEQTAAYMDLCGADAGHLVVFDMRAGRTWAERIYREERSQDGATITLWGA